MSLFEQPAISCFLETNHFGSDCVFAFNGAMLAIGGKCSCPCIYDVKEKTIRFVCDTQSHGTEDVITAIAISDDSSVVVAGYINGGVTSWSVEARRHGTSAKLLHSHRITKIAFLGSNSKVVVADADGVITSLSLVSSSLCEIAIQSTIIEMHKPVAAFTSKLPDLLGFVGKPGFSLFRSGRRMEVLVTTDPFEEENLSCHVDARENLVRCMVTYGKSFAVHEVECVNDSLTRKDLVVEMGPMEQDIQCGFIVDFDYVLVIMDDGVAKIFDMDRSLVNEMSGLPQHVPLSNIQYRDGNLVFFNAQKISEYKIEVRKE